jgi:hypothetical protein
MNYEEIIKNGKLYSRTSPKDEWGLVPEEGVIRRLKEAVDFARELKSNKKKQKISEEDPYFIEVDTNGCSKCGHDRSWMVVGPDGFGDSQSFYDVEDAAHLAEILNQVYSLGASSKK